jgi:hypothetical protein
MLLGAVSGFSKDRNSTQSYFWLDQEQQLLLLGTSSGSKTGF